MIGGFNANCPHYLYFSGYLKNMHKSGTHVLLVHSIYVHAVHTYPSVFVRKEIMKAEYEKEKMKTRGLENKYRMKMLKNNVSFHTYFNSEISLHIPCKMIG